LLSEAGIFLAGCKERAYTHSGPAETGSPFKSHVTGAIRLPAYAWNQTAAAKTDCLVPAARGPEPVRGNIGASVAPPDLLE